MVEKLKRITLEKADTQLRLKRIDKMNQELVNENKELNHNLSSMETELEITKLTVTGDNQWLIDKSAK